MLEEVLENICFLILRKKIKSLETVRFQSFLIGPSGETWTHGLLTPSNPRCDVVKILLDITHKYTYLGVRALQYIKRVQGAEAQSVELAFPLCQNLK